MNTFTRNTLAAAVLAAVALTGCKKKEEAAPPPPPAAETMPAPAPAPAPVAATATVASVDLGSAIGPDSRVTAPTAVFTPKDTIHASVGTNTSDPAANVAGKLGAKWTFGEGANAVVVNEETKDFAFAGPGVTSFTITKPDGWPVGKYKLEVSLDGTVVQTREFEVK